MYLGLVLVGATPQVLAQAAMTRQFDVKDEIEHSDGLDKKPKKLAVDADNEEALELDRNIAKSLDRFISTLRSVNTTGPICLSAALHNNRVIWRQQIDLSIDTSVLNFHDPVTRFLSPPHLPRAGLDPLLTIDAS